MDLMVKARVSRVGVNDIDKTPGALTHSELMYGIVAGYIGTEDRRS